MQVRQVLVTTTLRSGLIEKLAKAFASDPRSNSFHIQETRLVYVPQFTVETPSLHDFVKDGQIDPINSGEWIMKDGSIVDKDGDNVSPADQMRQLNKALEKYMPLNAERINKEIEAKTSEYIDKAVREYYGKRFISVEVHETIGIKQSVGLV